MSTEGTEGNPAKPGGGTSPGKGGFVPPSTVDLDAVLDQYEFLHLLGRGGMGAVYKARQKSLDRLVAIKILPPHQGAEGEEDGFRFAERFQREARAMAKLNHPNIVAVHDFGQAKDGRFYFVMEYVEGTDLAALIREGQLTPAHVLGWTGQICEALQYAHSRGIVHRDIKPANIMVTLEGQVKVADFGLAKLSGGGGEAETKLTMTNMAMGTPDYIAPEALEIGVEVDHRADLYAVGVMLYEMLTGRVPRGNFKPPSAVKPGLDLRYDDLVAKAMESDRGDRFQEATEIRATLYEIATTAPPAEPAARAGPDAGASAVGTGEALRPGAEEISGGPHRRGRGGAGAGGNRRFPRLSGEGGTSGGSGSERSIGGGTRPPARSGIPAVGHARGRPGRPGRRAHAADGIVLADGHSICASTIRRGQHRHTRSLQRSRFHRMVGTGWCRSERNLADRKRGGISDGRPHRLDHHGVIHGF